MIFLKTGSDLKYSSFMKPYFTASNMTLSSWEIFYAMNSYFKFSSNFSVKVSMFSFLFFLYNRFLGYFYSFSFPESFPCSSGFDLLVCFSYILYCYPKVLRKAFLPETLFLNKNPNNISLCVIISLISSIEYC